MMETLAKVLWLLVVLTVAGIATLAIWVWTYGEIAVMLTVRSRGTH